MSPDEKHNLRDSILKEIGHNNNPSQETKEFMKETRVNFKEVSEGLKGLEIHLIEVKQITNETKNQTTKTNGRVGALEEWRHQVDHIIRSLDVESSDRRQVKKDNWKQVKNLGIGKAFDVLFKILMAGTTFVVLKDFIL